MRLTALQLPARFDEQEEQLAFAEALLESGSRTDLVLLPEASLTGYVSPTGEFDLTRFAEPLEGPTRQSLAHLARRFDCLVVGPLIERAIEGVFNSMLGITPDGSTLLHYRKHHPWFPEKWATPGETPRTVVTWRERKLTIAICFDVHFLEADAGPALDEAELLLFPSAWVDDDEGDSRPPLLQALAAKHSVAVLNANWGPGTSKVPGQGGSLFVDATGVLQNRLKAKIGRVDVTLP